LCFKICGLKKIPFALQGSDTGEYSYVRSHSFDTLIENIIQIRDSKNPQAIILRGPQGSGKTATKRELLKKFFIDPKEHSELLTAEQNADYKKMAIFTITLSSLNIRDLTWSFVNEAKLRGYVSDQFLKKIDYSENETITPKLEQNIIQIIEHTLKEKDFGIWVIDEFDIIALPQYHGKEDQTKFLHIINDILNGISESKIIQQGKSFCTILAQTEKSALEFRDYIVSKHGPLASRLPQTLDINYNSEETLQIIEARLKESRKPDLDSKLKSMIEKNPLYPLSKDQIDQLYVTINNFTQTKEMIAFRMLEQILYNAIMSACKKDLENVDMLDINFAFENAKKK